MTDWSFTTLTVSQPPTKLSKTTKSKKAESLDKGGFVSYSRYSRGCRALSKALGLPMYDQSLMSYHLSHRSLAQKPPVPFLINWGNANPARGRALDAPESTYNTVYNTFAAVSKCASKALFFPEMKKSGAPRIPEFTLDLDEATEWAKSGIVVLGRKAYGSSGKDVAFFTEDPEGFVSSNIWVQYKKKKAEFRVHIVNGEVILLQQKVLPSTDPDGNPIPRDNVDFRIRTHRTGFIFQKHDIKVPDDVVNQAQLAFQASGLDFGAVDVIYNQSEDKAYVLEINTAPGLEGSSPEIYRDAFLKHFVK